MIRVIISDSSLILKSKLNSFINESIDERDDFNFATFDFEDSPIDDILEVLESPSFTSDRKVVVCKNPFFLKDNVEFKPSFENDYKSFEKYISNPCETSDLIIVVPEKYLDTKNKIYQLLSNKAEIINLLFEDEKDFYSYGIQLIEKLNLDITSSAIDCLIERCQGDVCKLEKEIAKLSLYGSKIDANVIDKMVSKPLETNVFDLSNAILCRNHNKAMQVYNDLKLLKTEPIALIALLAKQFRTTLQVSILKKQGRRDNEIAEILKVKPYAVTMALKNTNYYDLDAIKDILIDLANLDYKIKSGEADRYIDFELFLATK